MLIDTLKGPMLKRKPKACKARKNASLCIIPNSDPRIPSYARIYEELKGLCIGGCISVGYGKEEDDKPWSPNKIVGDRSYAHAHNGLNDPWFGWICSPYKGLLTHKWVLLHEVAHLIVVDEGHTKKWRKTVELIGGSLKPKVINRRIRMLDYQKENTHGETNSGNKRCS